ncbi:MAG TPA: hypothetical protein VM387_05160, partial [Gemmatimonadales bacterium]|nr:hypothetical protein [Gemmatimonadales bacterium]
MIAHVGQLRGQALAAGPGFGQLLQGLTSQLADVHDHLASVEERLARVPAGPALDAVRARANDVRATI